MLKRARSTSTSFLAELIIVIFFLIVSAAIISQAFATAERLREQARDLNISILRAQDLAEAIRQLDDLDEIEALLDKAGLTAYTPSEDSALLPLSQDDVASGAVLYAAFYDREWLPQSEASNRKFLLTLVPSAEGEEGTYLTASIEVFKNDVSICQLETARFLPVQEGGDS